MLTEGSGYRNRRGREISFSKPFDNYRSGSGSKQDSPSIAVEKYTTKNILIKLSMKMFLDTLIIIMRILRKDIKMLTILYIKNHHCKKQYSTLKGIRPLYGKKIPLMKY